MHLGLDLALELREEHRLRLAARIVEIWADPWRRMEPGPEPMTAEEIAAMVEAGPNAVRKLFATNKVHVGAQKHPGRPAKWSVVIPPAKEQGK
jgi:hypothetical protein